MYRSLGLYALLPLCSLIGIAFPAQFGFVHGGVERADTWSDRPRDLSGLGHVLWVSPRLLSGSEPQGEGAFRTLSDLKVKVVVSVDASPPQLPQAGKNGIQYIHIPIGYDGVSKRAGLQLARVVRDHPGRIYFHCHRGKHRGPAAAAIAFLADGGDLKKALDFLKRAGTSEQYRGLWRDVNAYTAPPADATLPLLTASAEVDVLATMMASLDRHSDRLKESAAAGWKTPANDPAAAPEHQALLVREALRESARRLPTEYDERFRRWLAESERRAEQLESALRKNETAAAKQHYLSLRTSCQQCHRVYRD